MASELTDRATDGEITRLSDAIEEQRQAVREYLARELGGDPDDYSAERWLAEHGN